MSPRAVGAIVCLSALALTHHAWAQSSPPPEPAQPLPPLPPASSAPLAQPEPEPAATQAAEPRSPVEPGERAAPNAIYVEGMGPAIFYSLNIEHDFGDAAGRIGVGGLSTGGSTWVAVPITLSYIGFGSKKNIFEIGAGAVIQYFNSNTTTLTFTSNGSPYVLGTIIFGYRFQPPKGGFLLRAGFSPIFGAGGFIPWPHFALGAAF